MRRSPAAAEARLPPSESHAPPASLRTLADAASGPSQQRVSPEVCRGPPPVPAAPCGPLERPALGTNALTPYEAGGPAHSWPPWWRQCQCLPMATDALQRESPAVGPTAFNGANS
eukprot:362203-Chlamydomonas_euryale.AAC.4